eukprot:4875063-Prymnesium_polylepis.2
MKIHFEFSLPPIWIQHLNSHAHLALARIRGDEKEAVILGSDRHTDKRAQEMPRGKAESFEGVIELVRGRLREVVRAKGYLTNPRDSLRLFMGDKRGSTADAPDRSRHTRISHHGPVTLTAVHNVANPVASAIWDNCVTALFGLSRVLRTAL